MSLPSQVHNLAKSSSTRSCESLMCLTQRCNEEDKKEKEKTLNSAYFEKLSLKKFNNHSITVNDSYYDKGVEGNIIRRERSTEDSDFHNPQMVSVQRKLHMGNVQQLQINREIQCRNEGIQRMTSYSQFQQQSNTKYRIVRSSSHSQLNNQPQLKSVTEREVREDLQKIQNLSRLRVSLQQEILQLDKNIDRYYVIYEEKLEQLRGIQARLREVENIEEREKKLGKVPSTDDLARQFKKKLYPQQIEQTSNNRMLTKNTDKKYHLQLNTHSSNKNLNGIGPQGSNRSPKYQLNSNMSFVKKIN